MTEYSGKIHLNENSVIWALSSRLKSLGSQEWPKLAGVRLALSILCHPGAQSGNGAAQGG